MTCATVRFVEFVMLDDGSEVVAQIVECSAGKRALSPRSIKKWITNNPCDITSRVVRMRVCPNTGKVIRRGSGKYRLA